MRSFVTGLLFGLLLLAGPVQAKQQILLQPQLPLMPYPASVQQQAGELKLPQHGTGLQLQLVSPIPAQADYLLQHLQQRLSAQAKQPLALLRPDKGTSADKPNIAVQSDSSASKIPVLKLQFGRLIAVPMPGDDDSYQLQISPGSIDIQAATSTGALYAIETLAQLLDCQAAQPCTLPLVTVQDKARFGWRGLLLDSARRFIPLSDLKRTLQGMASAKLNVLHWHLTDDQGWRFQSQHYPLLTELASQGEFYTQAQMRELVLYAARLGIRLVPEIDFPGHASAIALAYPELMAMPGPYQQERGFGVFAPVLDVSSPKVSQFISSLLKEVTAIFPDPYLHIGGDEVKTEHWQQSAAIAAYMQQQQLADMPALHAAFNRKLALELKNLGKTMMGWDEVLHPDLPKNVLVQSWQGQDAVARSVAAGHATLLSAGFYLDQPMPTAYHYRNDPVAVAAPRFIQNADVSKLLQLNFQLKRLNGKHIDGLLLLLPATAASPAEPAQVRLWVPGRGLMAPVWLKQQGNSWQFLLDSWLGPGEFQLQKLESGEWQSSLMLGNTAYPFEITVETHWSAKEADAALVAALGAKPAGAVTDESAKKPASEPAQLSLAEKQLILGGEAALWTELAPAHTLDLKLWPRLYAVAERLWSPASFTDESQMYQRLMALDKYSNNLGLLQQQQQQQGLLQLAGSKAQAELLAVLSEVVEQSQYYSRHHLKTVRGAYHLDAPLDRLADALPAESLPLLRFHMQIQQLDCADHNQIAALSQQLTRWAAAATQLKNYQGKQQNSIRLLASQAAQASDIALLWLKAVSEQQPIPAQQLLLWQQQLHDISGHVDEEVMALATPVQQLLRQCRQNIVLQAQPAAALTRHIAA